jgi:AraC-like DNA-binding protein
VLLEITFAGGEEGIWFRVRQDGMARNFAADAIARHPALSAVLRLIADEVDMSKTPAPALLELLCRGLLLYVERMAVSVPLPKWGRPVRDRRVEKAVELLNLEPAKYWTVDLLARRVGLSRPAFARQFVRTMRLSPMRYLTERRMLLAAALLRDSDAALAEVAARVGYRSPFAFSRAFKRYHHVAPGIYRQAPPSGHAVALALAA